MDIVRLIVNELGPWGNMEFFVYISKENKSLVPGKKENQTLIRDPDAKLFHLLFVSSLDNPRYYVFLKNKE